MQRTITGLFILAITIAAYGQNNIPLISVDSIVKDKSAVGQTPKNVISPSRVYGSFYTYIDTVSTNAGYAKFLVEYYSTSRFTDENRWSMIDSFTILTPGNWDTMVEFEINSIGFRQRITPIDTTQSIKIRSDIIWDYK